MVGDWHYRWQISMHYAILLVKGVFFKFVFDTVTSTLSTHAPYVSQFLFAWWVVCLSCPLWQAQGCAECTGKTKWLNTLCLQWRMNSTIWTQGILKQESQKKYSGIRDSDFVGMISKEKLVPESSHFRTYLRKSWQTHRHLVYCWTPLYRFLPCIRLLQHTVRFPGSRG